MKLIFMGTPQFAVPTLKSLLAAGHEVTAVFTQPDRPVGRHQVLTAPPVKELAVAHGLTIHQPEKIRTPEARESYEPLLSEVDVAIVAAYGRILPEWMLAGPRLGCVNIHSSLLPKYRGAAPINWAIARGETVTGVTIMQMDAGMDTGAILRQASLAIGERETAEELFPRLAELGAELLLATLPLLASGEIQPQAQNEAEATYAPILRREDGLVDWGLTAREIDNRRRGFTPFPGCCALLRGQRIEIIESQAESDGEAPGGSAVLIEAAVPGTIVALGSDWLSVACGGGTRLRIGRVQPAGRRAMGIRDLLNGTKLQVGDLFDR